MARPTKTGLEYFSLDTKMSDEVELIRAKFGTPGFGVLIIMFQTIYDNGYYYPWTEREQLLFSMKVSDIGNSATSIINEAIKWGIFNNEMFEEQKILTSRRIQNTYVSAVYKRVGIQMIKEYLLVDVSNKNYIEVITLKNSVNDNINKATSRVSDIRNSPTTIVSDSKSTQSKVKEIILSSRSTSLKFNEGSKEYELSLYLREWILKNKPNARVPKDIKAMQSWCSDMDKILRIDKRDFDTVKAVIDFCQKDNFWQRNILSVGKLREKFDQLEMKMPKVVQIQKTEEEKRIEELLKRRG